MEADWMAIRKVVMERLDLTRTITDKELEEIMSDTDKDYEKLFL